ncbi:MAG TPA: hypothetical protein VLZ50_12240 [Terracidiphilus sp.]|nr:hypothetical protein [Terracidiphilus sp.]
MRAEDVKRYFPRSWTTIELQLGGLRIDCALSPEFWKGRPEITDTRLREWLRFKAHTGNGDASTVLEMTPAGSNCFTVQVRPTCH